MRGRQGNKEERWQAIKCPINLVNECPSWRRSSGKHGLVCVHQSQVQHGSRFLPPPLTGVFGQESSSRTNGVCGSGCSLKHTLLTSTIKVGVKLSNYPLIISMCTFIVKTETETCVSVHLSLSFNPKGCC